jgi:ABC-2 type transport system permease protein
MLDIWAMYWKECKELFFQGSKPILLFIIEVVWLGGWLPYQLGGSAWLQLPIFAILQIAIAPVLFVAPFVADSFAGERERHTLETLLATSLSDVSIVAGKFAALLTMTMGTTLVSLLVGFVVANTLSQRSVWSFYAPDLCLITMLLSLTFSLLIIAIGILISLRAATARQAQQMLSYGVIGLAVGGTFLSLQLAHLPFIQALQRLSEGEIFAYTLGFVTLLDVVLIMLILMRFKRSRLIQS